MIGVVWPESKVYALARQRLENVTTAVKISKN